MLGSYLIRNGQVLDGGGTRAVSVDIRVRAGQIAEMGTNLSRAGETVIDADGLLVTPGLIDLHVHVFSGIGQWSIEPAEAGLRTGVTTMLDTGTAGALTYAGFHEQVIPKADEDIFALLNISLVGCIQGHPEVAPCMGELSDARYVHVPSAVRCLERYGDRLLGMKVRLTAALANHCPEHERLGLAGAVEAAARTSTFLMVHHPNSAIPFAEMIEALRPGDIVTHTYHGRENTPFSGVEAAPSEALLSARERGILFDVGHGVGSFAWRVAEPACQLHGFWPDTISTDIHSFCVHGPVFDLPTTLSKFLHLGMPLPEVIRAATSAPARAMRLADRHGLLKVGRAADIALLRIEQGQFDLLDVHGDTRTSSQRIVPVAVLKQGRYRPCQHPGMAGRIQTSIV